MLKQNEVTLRIRSVGQQVVYRCICIGIAIYMCV